MTKQIVSLFMSIIIIISFILIIYYGHLPGKYKARGSKKQSDIEP